MAQVLGSFYSVLRSRPVVRCVQCRRVLKGSRRIRGRKVAGKEMAEQDMEYTLHIYHCWTKKMKNLFFFPLAPFSATVSCSDCFTGQSPGKRGTRRAKVQGPCRCLREWRKSTGRGSVGRGFGQELAPVRMIGFNVVKIWGGFAEKGGCKGGHGCMCQGGGPACSESGCNALLEDGRCLSRFGSC